MRKALWFLMVAILMPAAAVFAAGNASKTMPGDAEALATLVAVDQHEIAVAKQAEAKGVTGNVLDFAKRMEADHGKNLEDTRRVARENKLPLASSASIRAMEAKGRADMQAMAKLSGAAYAKAYADAMVKGHTEVLAKLDAFISGATDPEVVAHLKSTREAVAMHLEAAKALQ
jgi:putative membrane protein